MIRFFAEAVPNALMVANYFLIVWAMYDILSGLIDFANNKFDPQNSPTNKIVGGIYKAVAFLFVGMINTDLELEYHPLYLFTTSVVDNINGIGESIWFGCAILVTVNFAIIVMIAFSKFTFFAKFFFCLVFLLIIEGVNSTYDYLT